MKNTLLMTTLLALFSFNVYAECDEEGYFDCGNTGDVRWYVSEDKTTLIISGTGQTGNYEEEANPNYNGTTSQATHRTTATWGVYNDTVTKIEVSEGVTGIGKAVFEGFDQVTNVTLPNTLESIGHDSFNRTTSLTNVDFPSSLTSLGISAFWGSGLTSVVVPDTITSIERGLFMSSDVTNVTIPDSITSIGDWSFANTQALENLVIPDTVTQIADTAFTDSAATIYCAASSPCADKGSDNIVQYEKDKSGALKIGEDYYATANDLMNNNKCAGGLTDSCVTAALSNKAQNLKSKGKCSDDAECEALVNADYNGEILEVGGKKYASLQDLYDGNEIVQEPVYPAIEPTGDNGGSTGEVSPVAEGIFNRAERGKRIYTVQEAKDAAGKKNKVMIRYK